MDKVITKTEVYKASVLDEKYTLYFSSFSNLYLNVKCTTVTADKNTIQCFSYQDVGKTVVSHIRGRQSVYILSVLHEFLKREGLPLPAGLPTNLVHVDFTHTHTQPPSDYIVFSTHTHSFRMYIKENPFNYSIRIGGKEFTGCMEIFIDKPDPSDYTLPKLQQVQSEPECWRGLGAKGNTVDFVKGGLQLCQMLFGVSQFELEDASKIECGTTNSSQAPPRKFESPLSLAHLSLAKYGKTWYEANFNAFICDPMKRKEYQNAVRFLSDDSKKSLDFLTMAKKARLTTEQKSELGSLYAASSSWNEFFSSIPKTKQCEMFLKWLPPFLDEHVLHFQPTHHKWCIWLDSLNVVDKDLSELHQRDASILPMERTDLYLEVEPERVGTFGGQRLRRRNRKTRVQERGAIRKQSRKQREHILSFWSS